MLESLTLGNVGPVLALEVQFASRLNALIGGNGVGKTLILDVAWWALTHTWAGLSAIPRCAGQSTIAYRHYNGTAPFDFTSHFDRKRQHWSHPVNSERVPALVVYARTDGCFSIWDPARNSAPKAGDDEPSRLPAFHFTPEEVWNGLVRNGHSRFCNGLICDVANWQREAGDAFERYRRLLRILSPAAQEPLVPGRLRRVSLDDVRDHPTLLASEDDVPVTYASAGVRRVVAWAYLLTWTWQEHLRATETLGQEPAI